MNQMKSNRLMAMVVLSFVAMYILMYLMVDTYANVYANFDQLYMVIAMTAAMILIEVAVMGSMYQKSTRRVAMILGVIVLVVSIMFIRTQAGISDKEFIKAMIPHHGAALLMCEEAKLNDPDIKKLCNDIISGQQSQIDWMKNKLSTLK